ncbi:NPC intracellular cholesterol transporter 1 [Frankliniella fusca]|uniref:NPC intracellular cholesterol transporter 1 n=1 Tax=Frankliniella fusca TaxID=407009 RepID=A0AAE1L6W8_9NEOP|nr:NPC intracellular cholesterol transporter 1 [Frankliniella fusca]
MLGPTMTPDARALVLAVACVLACVALPGLPAADAAEQQCIMYGECNTDEKGFKQNCVDSQGPRKMTDPAGLQQLRADCPNLFNEQGEAITCCDVDQIVTLHSSLLKAAAIYSRCPACFRNFFAVFCELTCSPTQSQFLEVVESKTNDKGKYITEINAYLTADTMQRVYDSCKGVVMPQSGKYATDITCGAYDSTTCNSTRWFDYVGKGNPLSPFTINFLSTRGTFDDMDNREVPTLRCNETSELAAQPCSCVDCDLSCPASNDDMFMVKKPFLIKVLGIDVYVLSLIVAYIIVFLVTAFCVRKKIIKRRIAKDERGSTNCRDSRQALIFLWRRPILTTSRVSRKAGILDGTPSERSSANTSPSDTVSVTSDVKEPSWLARKGFRIEMKVEEFFTELGTWSARNPVLVFFIASWIFAALVWPIDRLDIITNPVQLWASPTSQTRKDKDYFDSHFGPFYRAEQIFVKAVNLPEVPHEMPQGTVNFGPVFNKEFLLKVWELQSAIQNLGREEGHPLEEVCFAPLHNDFTGPVTVEKCTIQTIWGYFQNSMEKFEKTGEKNGLKTNYLNVIYDCLQNSYDPSCLAPYGGPAENLLVVGGFLDDESKTMVQADALVMNFVVNNHINETDNAAAIAWEKRLLDFLKDWETNEMPPWMDIGYMAERSIEDEIDRVSKTSFGIIALSYFLMIVYVSLSLGRFTTWRRLLIDSKVFVAVSGVLSVLASMMAALGVFAHVNYPTILLTIEAVPFLVLAVGVDNLFILVSTHERLLEQSKEAEPRPSAERIGRTLGLAGPAMLLTTLAEGSCFLIGASSSMPAVRSFAILAALALFFNFLAQCTVLMAVLALDERRMLRGRLDLFCCCGGRDRPPLRREQARGSRFIERLFEHVLAPALMQRWVRVAVPVLFVCLWLATLPCLPRVDVGLDQSQAMTKDSYVYKYFEFLKEILSIGPPVYFVVTKGLNYTDPAHQNLVCGGMGCSPDSLSTVVQAASKTAELSHIARPASSWLDDIFDWTTLGNCCKEFASNGSFCPHNREAPECTSCSITIDKTTNRPSAADMRKYVPGFLTDIPDENCAKGGIAAYSTGVNYVLDQYGRADVGASYFMGYHTPVRTSADYYDALRAARKICDKVESAINSQLQLPEPVRVFPYSIFYVYYEQYLTILWDTCSSLLLSWSVLALVMFLLNGLDVWASAIVSAIVLAVVMEMMATMYLWDISLNAVSAVNLVVAMGIAVEFNSHIMHAFQKCVTGDRTARAREALIETGSSVFSGIFLTKFCGIAVLAMAPIQMLEVYYFRMYLSMVLLSGIHGLILLPVLLSYFGPNVNQARVNHHIEERRRIALLTTESPT